MRVTVGSINTIAWWCALGSLNMYGSQTLLAYVRTTYIHVWDFPICILAKIHIRYRKQIPEFKDPGYYRIVKNFGSKKVEQNSVFETLAKKLWRIQGLPVFLVYDSSELRKLRNSACAPSIASAQDNSVLIQHKTFIECEMRIPSCISPSATTIKYKS